MTDGEIVYEEILRVRVERAQFIVEKKMLIGMTMAQAYDHLKSRGVRARTVRVDGKPMIVTQDVCYDRVNMCVRDGKVEAAHVG